MGGRGSAGPAVATTSLTGKNGLSSHPAVREVQIENRIREAYRAARTKPVDIDDLRQAAVGNGASTAEVNKALRTLIGQDGNSTEYGRLWIGDPSPRQSPGG